MCGVRRATRARAVCRPTGRVRRRPVRGSVATSTRMPYVSVSALGGEHVGGRAGGAHPAAVEQHDVVGDGGGLVEVVQHDADGDAVRRRRGRGPGRGSPPGSAGRGRSSARRAAARRCPGRGRWRARPAGSSPPESSSTPRSAIAATPVTVHRPGDRARARPGRRPPAAAVRVPAVPDDVAHADAAGRRPALRQQGDPAGELLGGQGERVACRRRGSTVPRSGRCSRASARSSVDLPLPFGPDERGHPPGTAAGCPRRARRGGRCSRDRARGLRARSLPPPRRQCPTFIGKASLS